MCISFSLVHCWYSPKMFCISAVKFSWLSGSKVSLATSSWRKVHRMMQNSSSSWCSKWHFASWKSYFFKTWLQTCKTFCDCIHNGLLQCGFFLLICVCTCVFPGSEEAEYGVCARGNGTLHHRGLHRRHRLPLPHGLALDLGIHPRVNSLSLSRFISLFLSRSLFAVSLSSSLSLLLLNPIQYSAASRCICKAKGLPNTACIPIRRV